MRLSEYLQVSGRRGDCLKKAQKILARTEVWDIIFENYSSYRFVLPGGEEVGRKAEAILSPGLTREKAELELRTISLPPCQQNIIIFTRNILNILPRPHS